MNLLALQLATTLFYAAALSVGAWGFWRIYRGKSLIPPGWGLVGTASVLLLVLSTGCSWIDRGAEHVGQLIDTRQEKQQRGWEWEDYLTCDMKPELHLEGDGERWCTRLLAPTIEDCLNGDGLRFWFGDSLSGMSRQVLYDLCRESNVGEQWPHLDGLYQNGKLVVRDANRGSKPL